MLDGQSHELNTKSKSKTETVKDTTRQIRFANRPERHQTHTTHRHCCEVLSVTVRLKRAEALTRCPTLQDTSHATWLMGVPHLGVRNK